jgi:hypothetical protein
MMMWDNGWGAGQWLEMTVMMLVFWTLLIGLVVWLIRSHRTP